MLAFEYTSGGLVEVTASTISSNDINNKRIRNYIDNWKNSGNSIFFSKFRFRIVYHTCKDLYSGNDYSFRQDFYIENENKIPTIHLSLFDYFNELDDFPEVKRYKKITDNSIWNYYVPIEVSDDNNFIFEHFNRALKRIEYNTVKGLYNLSVTHEYADINARLTEQSRLTGNHKAISPFLFHSEKEMQDKIALYNDEEKHTVTLQTLRNYQWRFLLLDDKSIESLSPKSTNSATGNNNILNKLQIITNNLTNILQFDKDKIWFRKLEVDKDKGNIIVVKSQGRVKDSKFKEVYDEPNETDIQIVIDCVEKLAEAEACLEEYRYEIVLLDYLLDNNEYGYQLLERIYAKEKQNSKSENKVVFGPGPNNRYYFMFISAFQTAVHERMLEKGFGRVERGIWFIGDGACPTNTPYLFSYRLLLLMHHRINELRIDLKPDSQDKDKSPVITLIDLLKKIYVNTDTTEQIEIRDNAHKHFNKVLMMRDKYHNLEKDLLKNEEESQESHQQEYLKNNKLDVMKMQSSLLIHSVYGYIHLFSGAMFEHLQHLVYLTAYGTIRQSDELWEEYIFVQKILRRYDELTGREDGKIINNAIRDYIIDLKENSN